MATEPRPEYRPDDPEELDAVAACPENHRVVLENDRVRVLDVTIPPRTIEEAAHTHKWWGVFIIDSAPEIVYYGRDGGAVDLGQPPANTPLWIAPEGPHKVENKGDFPFHAIRIELKG